MYFLGQKPSTAERGLLTPPHRGSRWTTNTPSCFEKHREPMWFTWPKSTIASKQEMDVNSEGTPGQQRRKLKLRRHYHTRSYSGSRSPLRSCPSARLRKVEGYFCPGTRPLLRHCCFLEESNTGLDAYNAAPLISDQYSREALETILRKLKRLASLPLHNTEGCLNREFPCPVLALLLHSSF